MELFEAIKQEKIDLVKHLVQNGADVNARNYNDSTPLVVACSKGYLRIVKYLVQNGADVNARNYHDETPFNLAYNNDNLRIMKYLVENGVDFNAVDNDGETPITLIVNKIEHEVNEQKKEELMKILEILKKHRGTKNWNMSVLKAKETARKIRKLETFLNEVPGFPPNVGEKIAKLTLNQFGKSSKLRLIKLEINYLNTLRTKN